MTRTDQGVVFVPGVLPAEEVDVDVVEQRKDYARARLRDVLTPSPDRRDPSCPNFETVGCCEWDYIRPQRQVELKESILRESLLRLGGVEWEGPIEHISSPEAGYRLRAAFKVHDGELCFLARASRRPVVVRECKSLMPALNGFLGAAHQVIGKPEMAGTDLVRAIASPDTNQVDAVFHTGRARVRWLDRSPVTRVLGLQYRLRPDYFFQPNRFLLDAFMSAVARAAGSGELALDLFCGSGFFSLPLAGRYNRVIGVERRSVANARWNARRNRIRNVEFVKAPVWTYLKKAKARPDTVVLNPPRTGAGKAVIRAASELEPGRIVYISCDPTTFAPEARLLLDGRYRLKALGCLDQFPNTHHIETIALFESVSLLE